MNAPLLASEMHLDVETAPVPVTVIIVNYNSGQDLKRCLDSVFRSQTPVNVVVVDNNSTDDSLDQAIRPHKGNDALKVIRNAINAGFAYASNQALPHAKGNYWLFLNPDCYIEPDTLQKMTSVMESHQDVAMAGPLIVNMDGSEQRGCRRTIPTPWRSFIRAFGLSRFEDKTNGLFKDFLMHKDPLPDQPIDVEAISGAFMLVRKSAIDEIGHLDDGYFLHCEDLDWCMRFREKGWRILFVPDTVITHRKGGCSENKPIFVLWHMHRGMIRFYKKFFRNRYPGILMWLVMAGVWLRFFMLASYHFFKNLFLTYKANVKAKVHAFRSF